MGNLHVTFEPLVI